MDRSRTLVTGLSVLGLLGALVLLRAQCVTAREPPRSEPAGAAPEPARSEPVAPHVLAPPTVAPSAGPGREQGIMDRIRDSVRRDPEGALGLIDQANRLDP